MSIRWTQSDYVTLGKAISNFNKKRNQLLAEENKNILPNEQNYKEMKEDIKNRQELTRYINKLKRFQKEDATDIVTLASGEQMTKWERQELNRESKRYENQILNEIANIDKSKYIFKTDRQNTLENELRSLRNLENKKGKDLKILKARINYHSRSDYDLKKAIVFRENYIEEMKKYEGFANYKLLEEEFNKLINPIKFYEHVKGHGLLDDLTLQSDEFYGQARFNQFVLEWVGNNKELEDVVSKQELKTDIVTYGKYRKRYLKKKKGGS